MIWFFERDEMSLKYEIQRSADGERFEIVLNYSDGSHTMTVIEDATALVEEGLALPRKLINDGWRPASLDGTPGVLSFGPESLRYTG